MNSNALRDETLGTAEKEPSHRTGAEERFQPQSVRPVTYKNGHADRSLRMYTEEQVSEMLQVSLSQLRKWRMKENRGRGQGPPFRKIGRLVRYAGQALETYVNGSEQDQRRGQERAEEPPAW